MLTNKTEKEYILPARISEAIEKWFDKDYRATFFERIDYLLESEPLYENLPYAVRYGRTLEYILNHISVFIQPGEKIVGSVKEIIPTEEQKEIVENLSMEWWGISQAEIQKKAIYYYSWGWLRRRPPYFMSMGHLALDWEGLVSKGLAYYERHAKEVLQTQAVQDDQHKVEFTQGAILCYQALSQYINRYAEEAKNQAERTEDPARKAELEQIGASCEHISQGPARGFHEALQLIWFIVLPLMKVAGCGVFNLQRMDQYLLPLYQQDVKSGVLTPNEAVALIEEFYHKNNDIMAPTDHMSQEIETTLYNLEVTYDDPNYITIAGLLDENQPGVNELSYLFIEATHEMRLRNPFIVVRYYPEIEEEFWLKVIAAMRDNATIVICNDTTMIPALQLYGVAKEDVYEYGFYGCNDPLIPAKEGGLRQVWFNMLRPLELALNSGEYPLKPKGDKPLTGTQYSLEDRMIGLMTGPYYGIKTKNTQQIKDMEDLLEVYRQQVRFLIEDYRQAFEADYQGELSWNAGRIRIEDCFLQGTIDNAESWVTGGTKYHKVTFQGCGTASVADSLAAIEQLVFRDQELTLEELSVILREDFAGHEDLQIRLRNRMPKFGNDIEWVDELANRVVDIFCDEVQRMNGPEYVYQFFPLLKTDRDFTTMGLDVGATPDGRSAGEQISENQSPTVGADKEGLTALLNSAARLPFERITGGPLNIRFHPSAVKGDNGLRMLAIALKTYFERGGLQIQINVMSREQLLGAQQHPEKYKNLCVRVTGYSAYFVQMGKKAQDELINRTEQR